MAALDCAPEERDAFVAGTCSEDEELCREVRAMLALHREAGDFMDELPISPKAEAEMARLKPEEAGERIGRYKLLQEIGEGGFGVVWMAEQIEPVSRRVALKIIKLGMDTREVIGRFEQERQALAMMDHPNIAKVFDAGATQGGRPYFVMELVKGIPITQFCDEAGLGTRERLALFGDVCSAINHAHQKGVIHRDIKPSRELLTLKGSTGGTWNVVGVWGVAFSPDGKRILTGCQEKTAKVWDAATGRELLVLQHPGVVSSVAFSPDGQRLVTGVGEWGNPDGKAGEAKVWDAATGEELLAFKHPRSVSSVAFSPDGERIVTGSGDQTAKVWDAVTGQEVLTFKGHTGAVQSVTFSPDGTRILTGSQDKTAKVWDAATGRELLALKGHTNPVRSVTFSPDGQRIVTGSEDRTAKVWNAATGQELLALKGHTEMVWSVAFSPDGKSIVTGIAGAGATARVWSAAGTE